MSPRDDYFARVAPLLGEGLRARCVGFTDLALTGRVAELLVSCRLERLIVRDPESPIGWPLPISCRGAAIERGAQTAAELLRTYLGWKNESSPLRWCHEGRADLEVSAELLPPGAAPFLRWRSSPRCVVLHLTKGDLWSHQALSYHAARQARDSLLGRAPWPDGDQHIGRHGWPFTVSGQPGTAPSFGVGHGRAAHLLVIGCGSVGSEVVRLLARHGLRWTLVDPGRVSVFNPLRQWFGMGEVGELKVEALARRLTMTTTNPRAEQLGQDSMTSLEGLLEADRPDLAVLTTGTADHDAIAAALWHAGVPHVVACAYPQARFFEITAVDPAVSSPCLACFRGVLYRGREAAPPMDDELASFLYQELDEETRDRVYHDLVAEPAGYIETSRVADVCAMAALELLAAPALRGEWFQRLLRESTNCLLGGNVVERDEEGELAYGLSQPGQVVRLGLDDVVGHERVRICPVCGRQLEVVHRLEHARADDDEIDLALAG